MTVSKKEETEVKKDIEWLKKEFDDLFNGKSILTVGKSVVDEILNQLDEPEKPVELQELIEKYSKDSMSTYDVKVEREKIVNDLQNLIVPTLSETETVSDVVADFYEACERLQGVMSMEVKELEE